jgi:hypothetical protein
MENQAIKGTARIMGEQTLWKVTELGLNIKEDRTDPTRIIWIGKCL